jgi:hypothetical protein
MAGEGSKREMGLRPLPKSLPLSNKQKNAYIRRPV